MSDSNQVKTGIVAYTDGACRPQPGFMGWGVHGYMYQITALDKPVTIDNHALTTVGYVAINKLKGHVLVEPLEYFDFLGSDIEQGTNNQAEMMALNQLLEQTADLTVDDILVLTDSEYLKNGITDWCRKWEKNGWVKQDGNPVTNTELWQDTYNKVKEVKAKGVTFKIDWVKAHNDIFGNTHADILAVIGMNYSTAGKAVKEFKRSPVKGYWKQEIEKHPFINFKRIYFNSVDKFNITGHYFQADPGGSDFVIGKRIPETGFAIVKLNEPDIAIEAVKVKQYEVAHDLNAIIMMKLDRVYSKEVYPYLESHGKYCLLGTQRNLNVNFIDNKPVTIEMNPTGLSLRAIESFNMLEDILTSFLTFKETGYDHVDNVFKLNAHNVTDQFYDITEKTVKKEIVTKHILKPEFNVGFRDLMLNINEDYQGKTTTLQIPLILGTDLLPRNNLKKLEDHSPIIYLITWRESVNAIRYATVIECSSGIGIWSNFFSDKIFFSN